MKVVIEIKDTGNAMKFNTTAKGFEKGNLNEKFYANLIAKVIAKTLGVLETELSGLPDIDEIMRALDEDDNANV